MSVGGWRDLRKNSTQPEPLLGLLLERCGRTSVQPHSRVLGQSSRWLSDLGWFRERLYLLGLGLRVNREIFQGLGSGWIGRWKPFGNEFGSDYKHQLDKNTN